jgi:catecholate siderophore receptor
LIQQQGATNLRDALRNVTGISFQAGEGGGAQGDNLSLRGFNARNDFFLDGVRDQGSYFRDVFNIEGVEVLKGPSALYCGIHCATAVSTAKHFRLHRALAAPQPQARRCRKLLWLRRIRGVTPRRTF